MYVRFKSTPWLHSPCSHFVFSFSAKDSGSKQCLLPMKSHIEVIVPTGSRLKSSRCRFIASGLFSNSSKSSACLKSGVSIVRCQSNRTLLVWILSPSFRSTARRQVTKEYFGHPRSVWIFCGSIELSHFSGF